MNFASDNTGPAHPDVLAALVAANAGYAPGYGADDLSKAVQDHIRRVFDAPEAAVYLVATGTAANALLLATMAQPWQTIYCTDVAHIHEDECNAPEFYSGAKLTLVETQDARMTPAALRAAYAATGHHGVQGPQRGPLSLTNVTERGTLYDLADIAALSAVAHENGQQVHLDGARLANALVALDCAPAAMTWQAGVDAVSFGGTKDGLLGVEACVMFDPEKAWEFELRRKRGGHLFSKHRYLAAQMQAYLKDDLWLDLARRANARAADLVAGLSGRSGIALPYRPQANMIYFTAPRSLHRHLLASGAVYYVEDGDPHTGPDETILTGRLVTDWATTEQSVQDFLALLP